MPTDDDGERYTAADLRQLCFAAAEHFDWIARSALRASKGADSGAVRFQMIGRARTAEELATYMRAVGNHQSSRDDN